MKKIIFVLAIIATTYSLQAQQIGSFSQAVENHYLINPAAAGATDAMPLFLGYRRMWTGIDAAPSTQFITYNMSLPSNMGMGVKLYNFSTGPISKTGLSATYSYALDLGNDMKLSFGLSASLYQFYLDKTKLTLENTNDNTINYSSEKLIVPDANFGVYFHGKNYFVGLSSFQLFNRSVSLMNEQLDNAQTRHYFLQGGYLAEIGSDIQVEPSMVIKFIEAGVSQWDFNVKTLYKEMLWLGLGYRSDFGFAPQDFIISLGVQQDKIKLGYAYDICLSEMKSYQAGTHEIILIYTLGKSKSALKF